MSKVVLASEVWKKMFPERRISQEDADALREKFEAFKAEAIAAGWSPEYIASLYAGPPNGSAALEEPK